MITRLPDDALVRTTLAEREQLRQMRDWTTDTELLAQLVEEVSILAAERRRKSPREVPRPKHLREAYAKRGGDIKRAVSVLKATSRTVYRPGG